MASTSIWHDKCPKCGGELISSVASWGLLQACCQNCGYEPTEEEYKEMCNKEVSISETRG